MVRSWWINALFTTIALEALPSVTQEAGNHTKCTTSPAVVGGSGSMTFYFRKQVDVSSEKFHAYVQHAGDKANVLHCDRKTNAGVTCTVINDAFKPTSIVSHSLTLTTAKATQDLAGVYTLKAVVNGTNQPPVECNFVVKNATKGVSDESNTAAIVGPLIAILLLVGLIIAVFVWRRRRRKGMPTDKGGDEADQTGDKREHKRWYRGILSEDKEREFLQFSRNGEGFFCIAGHTYGIQFLVLAVNLGDEGKQLEYFPLRRTETGYTFLDTGEYFHDLPDLVAHYRDNELVIGDTTYGKLARPSQDTEEDRLYEEEISEEQERQLQEAEPGSFLCTNHALGNNYLVLAVLFDGEIKHFPIRQTQSGIMFLDESTSFETQSELVEYYRKNDIRIEDTTYGRLTLPLEDNISNEAWYAGQMQEREARRLLAETGQYGSFLIRDGPILIGVTSDGCFNCCKRPDKYHSCYELEVYTESKCYRIVGDDDCFKFVKAGDSGNGHQRLSHLVEYYREHNLKIGNRMLGKLTTPVNGQSASTGSERNSSQAESEGEEESHGTAEHGSQVTGEEIPLRQGDRHGGGAMGVQQRFGQIPGFGYRSLNLPPGTEPIDIYAHLNLPP